MPPKRVAIVTSSTRSPRLNPTITQSTPYNIRNHRPSKTIPTPLRRVCHPRQPTPADPTPHYSKAHTRAWSAVVRQYDAFIFVTPQYNWSIPASLKNALDYLYFEWKGKPAGIVSYGGRGGGKAADHLRGILTGLRMRVVGTAPGLPVKFTGLPVGALSEEEEKVQLDERDLAGWKEAGVEGMMQNLGMELVCELDKE
ncbi:NADPH-dependent FMN reductase [Penicillium crustosum]|uniref:NADPH-dependent FMN reductase n=1 Tax=Penicillium crustosum TaxID=36656 RepID=UPI002381F4E1|nr:NADPH-dependent FMN reductase [Penicillium crustosum]KAJ5410303.1 NADPH-dependent FMN reductase [Penicillium crustosum]